MQVAIKTINENGLAQIAEFLAENHKNGQSFTKSNIHAWAEEAEFSLSEGNDACIEVKARDSMSGFTQTFTVSDEGIDSEMVEVE